MRKIFTMCTRKMISSSSAQKSRKERKGKRRCSRMWIANYAISMLLLLQRPACVSRFFQHRRCIEFKCILRNWRRGNGATKTFQRVAVIISVSWRIVTAIFEWRVPLLLLGVPFPLSPRLPIVGEAEAFARRGDEKEREIKNIWRYTTGGVTRALMALLT